MKKLQIDVRDSREGLQARLGWGNGMQRQTRARQLGGTRGQRKEGVRSRCSEGEVIYTDGKPPRYESWATLASYHTVASASDYLRLSIFACMLPLARGKPVT